MNIIYDDIADRAYLKDAAQKHADEIAQVFGADAVDVRWVWRTETTPRELVLVAKNPERQAEESVFLIGAVSGEWAVHGKTEPHEGRARTQRRLARRCS